MLDLEQYRITGSTARAIATSAEAAIRDGRLMAGDTLPTVRALAAGLGASPATVNAAYRILRERGLVIAEGRRGTRVAPRPAVRTPPPPRRYVPEPPLPAGVRDLTIGLPDPDLLPDLQEALRRVDLSEKLAVSGLEAADPDLLALASASFEADGIQAGALAVVSGAFDGAERVLQAHLRPGDRVIVEDPSYIGILDLLMPLSLVPVPVEVDEFGLVPDALQAVVERGAEAVFAVPRAQNPYGSAMDAERAAALRKILARDEHLLVIEDDHAGGVAGPEFETLVAPERERWAIIRSVSKTLHPDLRLAIVAGDETTIARVEGRQTLGPRWVSHVIQAVVVEEWRDPGFPTRTAHARDTYAARRGALLAGLAEHGIAAHGHSGLNVWVPVHEESRIVRGLDAAGWRVLAGERFRLATPPGIRVTTSTLPVEEAQAVAAAIAAIENAGRPRRLY
jgi:DNA-binding transcriptional MocR family regulator